MASTYQLRLGIFIFAVRSTLSVRSDEIAITTWIHRHVLGTMPSRSFRFKPTHLDDVTTTQFGVAGAGYSVLLTPCRALKDAVLKCQWKHTWETPAGPSFLQRRQTDKMPPTISRRFRSQDFFLKFSMHRFLSRVARKWACLEFTSHWRDTLAAKYASSKQLFPVMIDWTVIVD